MNVRLAFAVTAVALLAAVSPGSAFSHARLLPALAYDQTQLFTLSVPNEKDDATTNKVVMTVPEGFTVRLFEPVEGWEREVSTVGSGEEQRVDRVTWTASGDGTDEGVLFNFTAGGDATGTYTFEVEQSYSDGSVVNWAGAEDSDEPAPTVEVADSLGGSDESSSTLAIVALVLGGIGIALGGVALLRGSGRSVA